MNFDWIATYYDRLARLVFGQSLAIARHALLAFIPDGVKTLIIGGGSGDMLFGLAERKKCSSVVYLEPSQKFISQAKNRFEKTYPNSVQVQWQATPWQNFQPKQQFDLITTDYLLDLFEEEEARALIKQIANWTKPQGYWLYVDFCQNEYTAWWWRPLMFVMYRFFGLVASVPGREIPNIRPMASEMGFEIVAQKQFSANGIEAILFQAPSKD